MKTPLGWLAERYTTSPRTVRFAAAGAMAAAVTIVLTGGVVRVTGSGLGCPEWPACTDSTFIATSATGIHGAIEFGNRLLTGALCLVVGWLIIAARVQSPPSRPVLRGAWAQFWMIVLNAVVGGLTVQLRLSPYVVALHFLAAVLLLTTAVVTWERARPANDPSAPTAAAASILPRARTAGTVLLVAAAVLVVLGTVVTGTGPHAGDSSDVPRMPFDWTLVTWLHGTVAVGLIAGTALLLSWLPPGTVARRRAVTLLAVLLGQGAIGLVQVLTNLNSAVVALHVLGSALVWVGTVRTYLDTRGSGAAERPTPLPELQTVR